MNLADTSHQAAALARLCPKGATPHEIVVAILREYGGEAELFSRWDGKQPSAEDLERADELAASIRECGLRDSLFPFGAGVALYGLCRGAPAARERYPDVVEIKTSELESFPTFRRETPANRHFMEAGGIEPP